MNLVKKAFSLIVLSGLTQQTFGWFDNFKKEMMDNIHNLPVITGAAAGAALGLGICASKNKVLSHGLSTKDRDASELMEYRGKSCSEPRPINSGEMSIDGDEIVHGAKIASGSFTTSRFYSWTYNEKCVTRFDARVEKDEFDQDKFEHIEVTKQDTSFTRSWPRTFAVVGLFTVIGGCFGALIGNQSKKS